MSQGKRFLEAIRSDSEWLHGLLDSGPTKHGELALPFLFELWRENPSLAHSSEHRSMATACALSLRMRGKAAEGDEYADRYRWFRDAWDDGRDGTGTIMLKRGGG